MNKKLFFFALICILTSTLLVSCKNLTQSAVQEFSFSIDAATAAKIAEKAPASLARASSIPDTDTRSVSIALKLTSVTPGVFLCTDSTTTTMNALVGTTLTISNVPLNVQLKASLECFVDGVKVYTATSDSSFTLTDDSTYNLHLTLREVKPARPEYSTPYCDGYNWGDDFEHAEPITANTEFSDEVSEYCFDIDQNLWGICEFYDEENGWWYNYLVEFYADHSGYQKIALPEDSYLVKIAYDPVTGKIMLYFVEPDPEDPEDPEKGCYYFSLVEPDTLRQFAIAPNDTESEIQQKSDALSSLLDNTAIPFTSDLADMFCRIYAYDNKAYGIVWKYNDEVKLHFYKLNKYSLENGSLEKTLDLNAGDWCYMFSPEGQELADMLISLYEEQGETEEDARNWLTSYFGADFYDIVVVDDIIYVTYNESAHFINSINPQDDTDIWLINRGAILAFDTKDLSHIDTLGLKEVSTSFKAPANISIEPQFSPYDGDKFLTKAYTDSSLSTQATIDIPMRSAMCEYSDTTSEQYFAGTYSFYAIKPKKLVVSDDGDIYYKEDMTFPDDTMNQSGTRTTINYGYRIVTVDLENFSNSDFPQFELWGEPTDGFSIAKKTPLASSSWGADYYSNGESVNNFRFSQFGNGTFEYTDHTFDSWTTVSLTANITILDDDIPEGLY